LTSLLLKQAKSKTRVSCHGKYFTIIPHLTFLALQKLKPFLDTLRITVKVRRNCLRAVCSYLSDQS
jgi:hypothetical protein